MYSRAPSSFSPDPSFFNSLLRQGSQEYIIPRIQQYAAKHQSNRSFSQRETQTYREEVEAETSPTLRARRQPLPPDTEAEREQMSEWEVVVENSKYLRINRRSK